MALRRIIPLTLTSLLFFSLPAIGAEAEPTWGMTGTKIAICQCADADVAVFPDGAIRMYYQEIGPQRNVVSLISRDSGTTWTKESGVRASGAFPSLLAMTDGTWRMYLQTRIGISEGIGYLTSVDGLTWSAPKSLFTPGGEDYQIDVVGGHSVLRLADGTFLMTYIGTKGNGGSLFWATSSDGDVWVKKGMILDAREELRLHGVGIDGSELVQWDSSTIKLYFRGFTGIEVMDFVNGTFVGPSRSVIKQVNGKFAIVPGDPTLAFYGGRWHLFHGMGPRQDASQPEEGIYEASYAPAVVPTPTATPTPTPTPTPALTPKPTASVTKFMKTITCIKGKQVKKVIAFNPKCPRGWKKK